MIKVIWPKGKNHLGSFLVKYKFLLPPPKFQELIVGLLLRTREMGLWTLLEGCLLLANALAVLNEDRVLAPRGWSFQEYSGVRRKSLKGQIIGLIYAAQYLRVPLILLNVLCILVKLVSG